MNPNSSDQNQSNPQYPVPQPMPPAPVPVSQPVPAAQPSQQPVTATNPLAAMRKDEAVIFQIRRHPFGLLGIHITAGFMLLGAAVIIYVLLPHFLTSVPHTKLYGVGTLVFVIIAAIMFLFLAITHKVYWGNSWILTSDSLTQVTQSSLFDKQSSQLSLANLEDVTAEQNGPLSHMLNFGVLRVETAGERSKFVFPYCPNPNLYAQQVLLLERAGSCLVK
jgi:hypothetical protein